MTTKFENGSQNVLEIHANNGVLEIRTAAQTTKTYEMKNVDQKAKTLIVQQEVQGEFKLISPAPMERTTSAFRFEVQVPANGTQALKVDQERVTSNTIVVKDATPDSLVEIISGKKLSAAGRTQLEAIVDLKNKVAEAQAAIDVSKTNMDELTQDQTRLRQNIDSLNKVSGQEDKVRVYSSRLNDNEVKLAEIRDKRNELRDNLSRLNNQLSDAITTLSF